MHIRFARALGPAVAGIVLTALGLGGAATIDLASEKHYSVIEIAKLWAVREKTVRKIFEGEPGVIHWGTEEKLHKRGYRTLRVPETALHRVHQSCAQPAKRSTLAKGLRRRLRIVTACQPLQVVANQ